MSKKLTTEIIKNRIKNRNIELVNDYINSHTLTIWRCLKDGCGYEWECKPYNVLTNGTGCPKCKNKNENKLKDILINNFDFDEFKHQKRLQFNNRNYYVDFYVKKDGIKYFVEYNGKQHYEPIEYFGGEKQFKKQQKRDQELREYCEIKNINLIEIPYWLSEEEQLSMLLQMKDLK